MILPKTEPEIDDFLAQFEAGTLSPSRFGHAGHLLAGACYVHRLGGEAAIPVMREAIRSFNVALGGRNTATAGYHETVTLFWLKLLDRLHLELGEIGRAEFVALAVERFAGQKDILRSYYGFDVVASTEARAVWIEPILKSL